jgi:ADP-ribose 1''-phosphate phosphatase
MIYEERLGDVFSQFTPGTFLVHACNCYGNWGMGIAKELQRRYPLAYEQHKRHCDSSEILGTSQVIIPENIVCLFTSIGFGSNKGSPRDILLATLQSLDHFFGGTFAGDTIRIISPRINAGFFGVPWSATRNIILEVCSHQRKEVHWITCVR